MSNDEKANLVDTLLANLAVKITVMNAMAAVGIASSSYYYSKSKGARPDKYAEARAAMREEFEHVRGSRGYRYICQRMRMREEPIILSGKTVRRLMAEEGCKVAYSKKRRRYGSYAGEIMQAPDNIVERDFHTDAPNEVWLTDITEFRIPAGKVYLSPIIDCFDGYPVSWAIGERPTVKLPNTMLEQACKSLAAGAHPVIHNDRDDATDGLAG